ncbi:MAG: TRAP transporter substrate-binding protein [Alphaproteobacteria bacterium]|nr:TRAP transporter substrate-binding protein [Alphaproteobacteria bacterium]
MTIRTARHAVTIAMLAGSIGYFGTAGSAQSAEKWDMPAAYSAKNFISQSYIAFAEEVTKNSNGELEIVVHPAGSLYKGAEILRAVRSGQVPIGARYIGAHATEDPVFGVDTVPFLATNMDEAWDLYQASKPALDAALADRGLKLIYAAAWPPQGLFANKEITGAADMEGVKFRAYDANTVRLAELMGAVPTKTEATEISQAFSTGVAESMIASGAIGVFQKIWDYVDNFYTVNAWIPKSVVIVNQDSWDSLSDETKQVVMAAAAKAEADVWNAVDSVNDGYKKTLAENGMNVAEPNEQLMSDLIAIGQTMTKEWSAEAGDSGAEIIESYRAM